MAHQSWIAACILFLGVGCSGAADDGSATTNPTDEDAASKDSAGEADSMSTTEDTGSSRTDTGIVDEGSGVGDSDVMPDGAPTTGATIPNLKVAFVGDQGASSNTIAVLKLVKAEGAQFLVVLGDFDYRDDPDTWDANLTTGLGGDFPVFAAAGNHDIPQWANYQKKLTARLAKISGASCTGDYGVKTACSYLGLFFILSGVGTTGTGHTTFLKDTLDANKSIWRVCAWHKNQQDMQIGSKGDEVGWEAYQICQNQGALIMTGHEHSYARTKNLNALGDKTKGHGAFGDLTKLVVRTGAPGATFVTVSGLGGVDIRDYEAGNHDDDTWWASWYASNGHLKNGVKTTTPSGPDVGYGATFVTFNVDGNPKKARGYMKNLKGVEIDSYEITRE